MEYRDFEQKLAENLKNQTFAVDTDRLISGIHGESKKRKLTGYLYFFVSIGVVAGILSWVYFSKTQQASIANEKTEMVNIINEESRTNNSISDSKSLSNLEDINTLSTSNVDLPNAKLNTTSSSKLTSTKNNTKKLNPFGSKINKIEAIRSDDPSYPENFNKALSKDDVTHNQTENRKFDFSPKLTSLQSIESQIVIKNRKIYTDKVTCPSFKIHKGSGVSFAVIPEIGVFAPMKRFESSNMDNPVFQERKENEKTLEGISAALYARAYFRQLRGFYGQAGVSYSTLTEKMTLKYDYEKVDTTFGVISITVSQTGDTVTTIYGPILQRKRITGNKVRHHGFTLWDVPIGVGYEYNIGRVNIGLEAGVNLNMSMKSRGLVFQGDTTFVAPSDSGNTGFKKKLGTSYYFGVTASTPIFKNGDLFLACRMRYIPGSFSAENSPVSQSYHFAGLNLGYIHRF
jgi:hypothetical protein